MQLAQLLMGLRERAGMSMAEVVRTLGVPRATAYQWEQHGRPEPESLQRMLDLYCASDAERLEAWALRATR